MFSYRTDLDRACCDSLLIVVKVTLKQQIKPRGRQELIIQNTDLSLIQDYHMIANGLEPLPGKLWCTIMYEIA